MIRESPSKIFGEYLADHPDSGVTKMFHEWGKSYIGSSGHFVHALWNGDIDMMYAHADSGNRAWLEKKIGMTWKEWSKFWDIAPMRKAAEMIKNTCVTKGYGDGVMVSW